MFENIKFGEAGPGSAGEPEDIFDDARKAPLAPPPLPPSPLPLSPSPLNTPPSPPIAPPVSSPKEPVPSGPRLPWKLLVAIVVAVVVIGSAAWLSYYLLVGRAREAPKIPDETLSDTNGASAESEEEPPAAVEPTEKEQPVPRPAPIEPDSDQDGLSDLEEAALGTSVSSADTDDDGLFDREEAEVYQTNPLNPDTDGDTYLDGDEVSNGYNPNGSGKLFEVPTNE